MNTKSIQPVRPELDSATVACLERAARYETGILRELRKQVRELNSGLTSRLSPQQARMKHLKAARLDRALQFHQRRCNELYERLGQLRSREAA